MQDQVPYGFYTTLNDELFHLNRYASVQKGTENLQIKNRLFLTVVNIQLPPDKQDALITVLKQGANSSKLCERLAEFTKDQDGEALFMSLLKGCALE